MRLLIVAVLLAQASAVSAGAGDPWRDLWGWGPDPAREKYQELSGGEFPARPYDWFHRMHPFQEVRAYNSMFDARAAGVVTSVARGEQAVSLVVLWPGSGEDALDVTIRNRLVTMTRRAAAQASAYRFRAPKEAEFPLPDGASDEKPSILREGDKITVTFRPTS